jgi:PAS domain S-box-containing protein
MLKDLNILIIEDVRFDVELIERELKKAGVGFKSKCVFTKEEYVKALEDFNPDLVISDHSMPQFSSVEALRIFKERKLHIPFILVTGAVSEEFAVRMLKEGADDYILKGNLIRLPSAIEAAIRQKQAQVEKRLATEQLKQSEKYFRTLIENATDIIKILDKDLNVTYTSPSIERILGYLPNEIKNTNICEFMHPEDFANCKEDLKQILSVSGKGSMFNYRFKHKEGHWVDIESTGRKYSGKSEQNYILNCRDITDRKKIEKKLKYKIKELDTLIYMYSHDLKGPFCSLQGYVNIAKMEVRDETALKFIGMFENTTKKLDSILMKLVHITMINREQVSVSKVNVQEVLKEAINQFADHPDFKDMNIEIEIDVKEPFPTDEKLLRVITENLFHNAMTFRKRDDGKSEIFVSATINEDKQLSITVKDNGMGIPNEIKEEIFDMFFRGSHESKGSGLGLYIVKNAVDKLGGKLYLTSEPGNGAEFNIVLPEQ